MKYIFTFFTILYYSLSFSQALPCGTDEMHQKLFKEHPEYNKAIIRNHIQLEKETANYISKQTSEKSRAATYIIPVVFHVVHNYGPENISDAQIYDAVKHVNEQLRMQNADTTDIVSTFKPLAADTEIEIRLAQLDPDGNCTNGITRTASPLTLPGDHTVKDVIQWPPDQYLNIYVCKDAAGLAGHALLPSAADTIPEWDGIVMKHDYVGTIGTSQYFRRTVVTHEIGHYLNLQHIWGGNNVPNYYYLPVADTGNCAYDDGVADTPETIGWQSCNLSANSCSSLDNVQNYMDYAYCARMFTEGQKQRMHAALNSSIANRDNLWSPANLTATGTDGTQHFCKAEIGSNVRKICAGDSVEFYDMSYNGITQRNWTFAGGSPANSTDSSITVTYNTPGLYDVQLQVSDGNQTLDTTASEYILVLPATGSENALYENFENVPLYESRWYTETPTQNGALIANTGFESQKSLQFDNFNANIGYVFKLNSYPLDFSGLTEIHLSFDWAYAQKSLGNNDHLQILVSNDCGDSWIVRKNIYGTISLPTVDNPITSSFQPQTDMEWNSELVTNISQTFLSDNTMFQFKFTNDAGNHFYIDNIRIGHPDVMKTEEFSKSDISIFPNPTTSELTIQNISSQKVEFVNVRDIQGRLIQTNKIGEETKEFEISLQHLSRGTYIIELHVAEKIIKKKIVKL